MNLKNFITTFAFSFYLFVGITLNAQTKSELPCINKTFSIVVHVVKDSMEGNGLFGPLSKAAVEAQVQKSIDSLNNHFSSICVSFQVCEYRYIENYWYLDISKNTPDYFEEMRTLYNVENRINIYYLTGVSPSPYFVNDSIVNVNRPNLTGILLNNLSDKTIVQAMGVFFGLLTTSSIPGEKVNGSNSTTTGDKITDTPADPGVGVNGACQYNGGQKDSNGEYYDPITGNAMSVYFNCLCNSPFAFTPEQYQKMVDTYLLNSAAW